MSTVQNSSQEKRTIRVKDFLDDFRAGMSDEDLLVKYNLTSTGLEKFYEMLQERGILDAEDIEARFGQDEASADTGDSSFICPSCLASHDVIFDVCPKCGVSFHELISREHDDFGPIPAGPSDQFAGNDEIQERDSDFSDSFLGDSRTEPLDAHKDSFEVSYFAESVPMGKASDRFPQDEDLTGDRGAFSDTVDEIVPGLPLGAYGDTPSVLSSLNEVQCEGCKERMAPAVRDIYDRARSMQALAGAGICMVIGFLGLAALGWFETYSFGRLMVIYVTAASMIFGTVLSAVGAFMYLAREKVFSCSRCERVYPRA